MAVSVTFLAAWMLVTNKWANPSYTAAAPYHAAFLLGGFWFGRRGGIENVGRLFGAALAFAICLAGWALWQRVHGEARAHALFETPATLASAINLVLLPGLVLVSYGKRHGLLIAALVVLIAALMAGGSRGGWLGFVVGGLLAYWFGRKAEVPIQPKAGITLIGVFAAAWALSWLVPLLWSWAVGGASAPVSALPSSSMAGEVARESSVARLGLYELAWRSITPSSLLTGFGYLGYYYLLEAARSGIATYEQSVTYFAHNDYLQTLLELGLPGLAGLVGITAWPLIAAWRGIRGIPGLHRLTAVAVVAAMGSMAAHAMVDFPFYVPVCLLLYGTALGVLDSLLVRDQPQRTDHLKRVSLKKAVVAGTATLVVWILAIPVAAEAAAGYAHRQWRSAHGESAAYWFEVARRLEPRDWRYHWYAGQFWFAQAAQNRKPAAARLADQAFEDGFAANPREVRNLLGRITTHRQLRELLEKPADRATLLSWADHSVKLVPSDAGARRERDLVLKQFGQGGTPK